MLVQKSQLYCDDDDDDENNNDDDDDDGDRLVVVQVSILVRSLTLSSFQSSLIAS